MNYQDRKVLYLDALSKWGNNAQLEMAVEECAEFIVAKEQHVRGRDVDIVQEIADVTIMMEQMKIIFGENAVDSAIESKLLRLKERLGKHKVWLSVSIKSTRDISRQGAIDRITRVVELAQWCDYRALGKASFEPELNVSDYTYYMAGISTRYIDTWTNKMLADTMDLPFFRFSMFDNYNVID